MFDRKYKLAVLLITVLLVLGLTLSACTCQKLTEIEEPTTTPGEPAALSFEAAEYVNTDPAFSVKYPKEWLQQPREEPTTVFYAAAEKKVPALRISVLEGATFDEALTAVLSEVGSDIKIVTERETTLADGTPASEAVVKWETQGFGVDTFVLGVKKSVKKGEQKGEQKDEKWVIVAITSMPLLAQYDEALFSEIAHTLEYK
jgi:hypothetical protein